VPDKPGWVGGLQAAAVTVASPFAVNSPIVDQYADSNPPLAIVQDLAAGLEADAEARELSEVEEGIPEPEYGDHADPPENSSVEDMYNVDIPWESSPLFAEADVNVESDTDSEVDSDTSGESSAPQ